MYTITDIDRYTLAVGRAPFHAAKREDIYRKLRAREYSWPDLAKFSNEITDDLRDIVSQLLVHEDERPTPDQIVNHPYFRLGYIPLTLDNSCTSHVPKWPKIRPPSASTIRRGYTEEWFTLCKSSSVGEYEPGKTFGAYGSRRNKTVARDCQKEIESGKQPNIPFAKDTVYLPFPERTHWPFQAAASLSEIPEEKESSSEGLALVETAANDRVKGRLPRVRRREEPLPALKENKEPLEESDPTRRPTNKHPTRMRSVRKISNPGRVTAATATTVPLRVPKETRTVQRTKSTNDASRDVPPPETAPLRISKSAPSSSNEMPPPSKAQQPMTKRTALLRSVSPELPCTDPASVLVQLRAFRDNVARALEKKPLRSRHENTPQLPFVSKWVDYSRKHGVGFVLEDGTVGCLVAGNDKHPVTTAFVQNGHPHLNRVNEDPAHLTKVPIEYYAASKEHEGLSRIEVLDKHRREHLRVIWHKFARYMCVQLGNDDRPAKRLPSQNNFVKFYQRLGNVGFWGFGDGSIQV
jgi:myosin-1